METIAKEHVKLIQLKNLGLLNSPTNHAEKQDVINSIQQMGLLQIDTINVVNRAPYFVLWSRLGNYNNLWLDETHAEGHLFEYWAHAACFIPIEEYPYFRSKMIPYDNGWRLSNQWYQEHQDVIQLVLETIEQNGPTCSADFKQPKSQPGGWWNWKEEKIALENLWHRGDLMVTYRKNFQRYYDFPKRVLPDYDESQTPSLEAAKKYWVEKTVKILGATLRRWVADYFRLLKNDTYQILDELINKNIILEYPSPDFEENILVHKDNLNLVKQAVNDEFKATHNTLLNPFDPMIWDRERTSTLFNFDYSIECYLPTEKRKYGYFTLPILYQGNLIGRLDAKAHRKEKIFEIRQLHFEDQFKPDNNFEDDFSRMIQNCADWHQCPLVEYSSIIQPPFK